MAGDWTGAWPKKSGIYWTLVPGGTEPTLVDIRSDRWTYLDRDWDVQAHDWDQDAPSLFWSEPLKAPPPPDGFRLKSADQATWSILWPEAEGVYWLFHPRRPIALAQVTGRFRGFVGTEDAWEREESIAGEMFWSEPILPPPLPVTFVN